jgi:hypothetical protein
MPLRFELDKRMSELEIAAGVDFRWVSGATWKGNLGEK